MNKYKKVEKLLYNYKMLKISIENMEKDIEYLKEEDGVKGIGFDNISTGPTNKTNDIVADTVLSVSEKIHYLERRIEGNRRKIESIDKAIERLEDLERQVVIEKYINSKQWWQVASTVRFSERHCRSIRKVAIDKMVVGIYGGK